MAAVLFSFSIHSLCRPRLSRMRRNWASKLFHEDRKNLFHPDYPLAFDSVLVEILYLVYSKMAGRGNGTQ